MGDKGEHSNQEWKRNDSTNTPRDALTCNENINRYRNSSRLTKEDEVGTHIRKHHNSSRRTTDLAAYRRSCRKHKDRKKLSLQRTNSKALGKTKKDKHRHQA